MLIPTLVLALLVYGEPPPPPTPPPPTPPPARRIFEVLGPGKTLCRDWASVQGTPREPVLDAWLQGYLSGFNEFGPFADGKVALDALFPRLKNIALARCVEHPDRDLSWAAGQLTEALASKMVW